MRNYFPIKIIHKNKPVYLIWFSDEEDGVYCQKGRLLKWSVLEELIGYSVKNQLEFNTNEDLVVYDFDKVENWVNHFDINISLIEILDAWNLMIDIASSLKIKFKGDELNEMRNRIYNKLNDILIWRKSENSNLAKPNIEQWPDEDIRFVKEILNEGIGIFESN